MERELQRCHVVVKISTDAFLDVIIVVVVVVVVLAVEIEVVVALHREEGVGGRVRRFLSRCIFLKGRKMIRFKLRE